MEIAVPEGCTLKSFVLEAESQARLEEIAAEHGQTLRQLGPLDDAKGGKFVQSYVFVELDGVSGSIDGPRRRVTITITDA